MDRRGFLRALGFAAATVVAPKFTLALPAQQLRPAEIELGLFNQAGAHDYLNNRWIVRCDVFAPKQHIQIGCDFALPNDFTLDDYKRGLNVAQHVLRDAMVGEKLCFADLQPIPRHGGIGYADFERRLALITA